MWFIGIYWYALATIANPSLLISGGLGTLNEQSNKNTSFWGKSSGFVSNALLFGFSSAQVKFCRNIRVDNLQNTNKQTVNRLGEKRAQEDRAP